MREDKSFSVREWCWLAVLAASLILAGVALTLEKLAEAHGVSPMRQINPVARQSIQLAPAVIVDAGTDATDAGCVQCNQASPDLYEYPGRVAFNKGTQCIMLYRDGGASNSGWADICPTGTPTTLDNWTYDDGGIDLRPSDHPAGGVSGEDIQVVVGSASPAEAGYHMQVGGLDNPGGRLLLQGQLAAGGSQDVVLMLEHGSAGGAGFVKLGQQRGADAYLQSTANLFLTGNSGAGARASWILTWNGVRSAVDLVPQHTLQELGSTGVTLNRVHTNILTSPAQMSIELATTEYYRWDSTKLWPVNANLRDIGTAALSWRSGYFGTSVAVGIPGSSTGTITQSGVTSGTITFQPAAAAGTWTLTWPTTNGAPGEFLQTDGAGVTTWAAGGGGLPVGVNNNVLTSDGASGAVSEANLNFTGAALAVTGAATISTTLDVTGATTLGILSTATGSLTLANSGSAFTTTLQAGVNITASRTYTLPLDFGAAGTYLRDVAGNGTLSWSAAGVLPVGVNNNVLTSDGASGAVSEANLNFDGSTLAVTGNLTLTTDLTVPNGGTGASTFTAWGVLYGNTAAAIGATAAGAANTLLHGNGAGAPTFSAVDVAADVSGILPVANGGTGLATVATSRLLTGNGVGALTAESALTFDGTTLAVTGAATVSTTLGVAGLTTLSAADAATNTVTNRLRLQHTTSGTAVTDFGVGMDFELEENDGSNRVAASIDADWSDAGETTSADGRISFKTMTADGAATEILCLDGGGLQVATSAPKATIRSDLDLVNVAPTDANTIFSSYSYSTNATNKIAWYQARGTEAAPTILNEAFIAQFDAWAYDGSNFISAARIDFFTDGAPALNNVPGAFRFVTTPAGVGAAARVRFQIAADGTLWTGIPAFATPYAATISASGGAGADIGTKDITFQAGLPTGTGFNNGNALGGFLFKVGNGDTGTATSTQHTAITALEISNTLGAGAQTPTVAVTGTTNLGDGGGTNYTSFAADGSQVFVGTAGMAHAEISAYDTATTITIAASGVANKVQITAFDTNGSSNNATPDHTNDHLTIVKAGKYFVAVSISAESVAAGGADEFGFQVWKNNGATSFPNLHSHREVGGGGGDTGSISLSGIVDVAVSDTLEVWVWNEDTTDNIVIDDITMSIVQIAGT